MTLEAQRIAIAEACGWKWRPFLFGWFQMPHHPSGLARVPDYLSDLNAMHQAEKVLKKEQHWAYIKELVELTDAEWTDAYEEVMVVAHASAARRAEAFLKTIGKWENAK